MPGNDGFQLGLSWNTKKVGDVLLARGDLSDAYDAYRKSFDIATKLHGKDVTNADWQHDLSETDNKLGDVLVTQGKIDDAGAMYQNGLDVAKVPIRGDGDQLRLGDDLAWSYSKIGDIDVLEKKIEAALADYRNSLERRKISLQKMKTTQNGSTIFGSAKTSSATRWRRKVLSRKHTMSTWTALPLLMSSPTKTVPIPNGSIN